jgi:hypothetical protein
MASRERPFGILILVIVYLILAVLRFGEAALVTVQAGTASSVVIFCLAPTVLLGIFYLLISIGLYMLKRWAWILALVFAILGFLYALLKLVGLGIGSSLIEEVDVSSAFFAIPIVSLILNLLAMVVLFKNKDQFD